MHDGVKGAPEDFHYTLYPEHPFPGVVKDGIFREGFNAALKEKFIEGVLNPLIEGGDSFVILAGHSHGGGTALLAASMLPDSARLGGDVTLDPISPFECDRVTFADERVKAIDWVMRRLQINGGFGFNTPDEAVHLLESRLKELQGSSPCLRAPSDVGRNPAAGIDYAEIYSRLKRSRGMLFNVFVGGWTLHSGPLPRVGPYGKLGDSFQERNLSHSSIYGRAEHLTLNNFTSELGPKVHELVRLDSSSGAAGVDLLPRLKEFCSQSQAIEFASRPHRNGRGTGRS